MRNKKYLIVILGMLLLAFSYFLLPADKQTFGINKTIGWAWDFMGIIHIVFGVVFLFSLFGHLIMYLLKAKFSKKVVILNFIFLVAAVVFTFYSKMNTYIILIAVPFLILSALIMLYTNIIIALVRAKDRK